ncbi:MAG: hypothetical protein A3F14_04800 [Gammaproteobacteria bacterium RIFCSPHIGHO2_12_FULL_43_28]|nr:MAG: hypothetical protein A3F14_04800 [Gammaproteobacteria bacterium RIFCSPHIGHO2_12_FULL_43_28]
MKLTMLNMGKLFAMTNLIFTTSVLAADNEIVLINHFDHALNYTIGINPQVLPDLPEKFTINPDNTAKSIILDIQKEAYLRLEDNEKHSGFFGVELIDGKAKIHGYLSKGVAYSWKGGTVTFCTPEEYKKKNACQALTS